MSRALILLNEEEKFKLKKKKRRCKESGINKERSPSFEYDQGSDVDHTYVLPVDQL